MLTASHTAPAPCRDRDGSPTPPSRCDIVVVGAGIIGLGVARELRRRHPRLNVCVLEGENQIGAHQTGHNSGVVHAGIYYQPGSLKARLCVEGSRLLYDYCAEREIPARRCGKLIVARDSRELAALDELERRGRMNGVRGLRRLDPAAIRELEPHVRGVSAVYSPETGIVDFAAVARAFADDIEAEGGSVALGCRVTGIRPRRRRIRVVHALGVTEARHAVFCAGAWSDRLAVMAGAPPDPRIIPFRGAYLRLRPERTHLVRSLVYPVPDPSLPFLGVHFTPRVAGDVLIGPTALLVGARDAYDLRRIAAGDLASTLGWPGTYRMARRWWRTALRELRVAVRQGSLVAEAATYVPELSAGDVLPGPSGVRAQAVSRDGKLVDDFVFSETERALHVRNAPSPGATSSMAIGQLVAERAERAFGL
jgi:(S)-2-hydroxyglutarate dehydrogenase